MADNPSREEMTMQKKRMNGMKHYVQGFGVGLCALTLSACIMDGTSTWDGTTNDGYFMPSMPDDFNNPPINTQEYDTSFDTYHQNTDSSTPAVVVPQSYHLGGITNTPTAAKDEDKQWVEERNPNNYTIQIRKDNKASQVANTLQKMPKTERSVEVRSRSGDYLGLYGNYSSQEEAEKELNNLPSDVKEHAKIKKWHSVQTEVENSQMR